MMNWSTSECLSQSRSVMEGTRVDDELLATPIQVWVSIQSILTATAMTTSRWSSTDRVATHPLQLMAKISESEEKRRRVAA